jgi:hypothetical protein
VKKTKADATFTSAAALLAETTATGAAIAPVMKKSKKKMKKFSSILQDMMKAFTDKAVKREHEREALKKHLGGGSFQKVEKI